MMDILFIHVRTKPYVTLIKLQSHHVIGIKKKDTRPVGPCLKIFLVCRKPYVTLTTLQSYYVIGIKKKDTRPVGPF